jgi:very-short-patch-repair endonuclease
MIKGTASSVRRARKLRREMSLPEVLLWQVLRQRPEGLKWRHQHPAGEYDLDFYCDSAKLCVEVDSEAHERGDRPMRDARRDAWLEERGVRTMRVSARDVLRDLDAVVRGIVHEAGSARPSTTPSARSPSPRQSIGEDLSS